LSLTKFGLHIIEYLSALGYNVRKYRRNLGVFIEGITLKEPSFTINSLKIKEIPLVEHGQELPSASPNQEGLSVEVKSAFSSNSS
jgi:hypothetical protein